MVDGCFGAAGAMISWGRLGCREFKGLGFNRLLRGIRELRLASRGPPWSFAVGYLPLAAPLCLSTLALMRDLVHMHRIYLFSISQGTHWMRLGTSRCVCSLNVLDFVRSKLVYMSDKLWVVAMVEDCSLAPSIDGRQTECCGEANPCGWRHKKRSSTSD